MQGYYSLVQYSEYPQRFEFVNIGVVLFAEATPHVSFKFAISPRRVESAFGVRLGRHFQFLRQSMEDRLKEEFAIGWKKDQIDRFIQSRSGKIRFAPAKSILVHDQQEIVQSLYEGLVDGIERKPRERKVQTKLKEQFRIHEVENLLEKPKPVSLPQGVTVKAPYAYQNGSYNMINAISLRDDPDQALKNAGAQAAEGKWLYEEFRQAENRLKLIVVADLDGQKDNFRDAVAELMEENNVGFFPMSSLEPLVADIRENVLNDATYDENSYPKLLS